MNHRSYLLELHSPEDLIAKDLPEGIAVSRVTSREADRCIRLWTDVGQGYWSERREWLRQQWCRYLKNLNVFFCIASRSKQDIGFFELNLSGKSIKIEGVGLLPLWRGRGIGGGLLTAATQHAFELGAERIWLHTATDDHPNALPNYKKRGYRIYHEENLKNPMAN